MAIKDVIAAIRKEANITQEEMAHRLYACPTSRACSSSRTSSAPRSTRW